MKTARLAPQTTDTETTIAVPPHQARTDGNLQAPGSEILVPEDKLYTYAIMRTDVDMPPGKLASQAAHACAQSLIEYLVRHPGQLPVFHALGKSGSRIVLRAKNLSQVLRAHEAAHDAGLPCSLFEDAEHILPPDFTGEPVITGLGIGPATRAEMRAITKKFRCA